MSNSKRFLEPQFLETVGVMPVIVIDRVEDAVPIARALQAGGISSVEVTLRTPAALDALRAIKAECDGIKLGVGTVTNEQHLHAIAEIGVDFAVSPGLTKTLVMGAQDRGIHLLPGVASVSEVMQGLEWGLTCFKLFPAVAVGGIALLKSIYGPLPQACFCPTGGLSIDNFTDFIALPNVACVGGSWLVPKKAVAKKDWANITEIAKQTTAKLST